MSRYYTYACDNCQRVFGKEAHLNISSVDLNMSYFVPDKQGGQQTPGGGKWERKKILQSRNQYGNEKAEYHFCNIKCLAEYVIKQPSYLESVHGEKFNAQALNGIEHTLLNQEG